MYSKKLKIFYLAECVSLKSKAGDLIHVLDFLEVLTKKDHEVTVFIRGKKSPTFLKNNAKTFQLPDFPFPFSFFLYIICSLFFGIEVLIKKPDIIYERDNGINTWVSLLVDCFIFLFFWKLMAICPRIFP